MLFPFSFLYIFYLLNIEQILFGSLNSLPAEIFENICLFLNPSFKDIDYNNPNYIIQIKHPDTFQGQPFYRLKNKTSEDILTESNTIAQVNLDYFLNTEIFNRKCLRRWFYDLRRISIKFRDLMPSILLKIDFFKYMPTEVIIQNKECTNKKAQKKELVKGKCIGNITIHGVNEYTIHLKLHCNKKAYLKESSPLFFWWECNLLFDSTSRLERLFKLLSKKNNINASTYSKEYAAENSSLQWLSTCKPENFTFPFIDSFEDHNLFSFLFRDEHFDPHRPKREVAFSLNEKYTRLNSNPFIKSIERTINIDDPISLVSLAWLRYRCDPIKEDIPDEILTHIHFIWQKQKPTLDEETIKTKMAECDDLIKASYNNYPNRNSAIQQKRELIFFKAYYDLEKSLNLTEVEKTEHCTPIENVSYKYDNNMDLKNNDPKVDLDIKAKIKKNEELERNNKNIAIKQQNKKLERDNNIMLTKLINKLKSIFCCIILYFKQFLEKQFYQPTKTTGVQI